MKIEGSEEKFVHLQRDDRIKWYKQDGTIGFYRDGKRITKNSGDDKFLINPRNMAQFMMIAELIAKLHGLEIAKEQEHDNYMQLKFV